MPTVQVACDSCGARRQGRIGDTVEELRAGLRTVGWLCRVASGTEVDICPKCRSEAN